VGSAAPTPIALWGMVPTPFSPDGATVDHASLAALVTEMTRRGVTGVMAMGVIAEPGALSEQERAQAIATIADASRGLPLCVGLTAREHHGRLREAEELTPAFQGRPPTLLIPVTTADPVLLRTQWSDIHERTGASLIVQDYPAAGSAAIDIADLADAVRGLPFISAVKSEAPPTFWRIHQLTESTGVTCMAGLGGLSLIDELECGATAVACGITRPETVALALRQWQSGNAEGARQTMSAIAALINFEVQAKTSIGIRKEHWRRLGVIASAAVRPPSYPYAPFLDRCSTAHGFGSVQTTLG
jgi:4-hydroxy-tetrahydrodipicolinate synthase